MHASNNQVGFVHNDICIPVGASLSCLCKKTRESPERHVYCLIINNLGGQETLTAKCHMKVFSNLIA